MKTRVEAHVRRMTAIASLAFLPGCLLARHEPPPEVQVHWEPARVTIDITGPDTTGFNLGIAETADPTNGRFGEDCAVHACAHSIQDNSLTLSLDSVETEPEFVPGVTTLFDDDGDGVRDAHTSDGANRLTYIVGHNVGARADLYCFTWGQDPSYYSDTWGCTAIEVP